MNSLKNIFVLIIGIVLFSSCEKEKHPPYSNKTIQIVVQGEISSELGVEVMIGRALPAFVSLPLDSLVINDALVTLLEDGVIVDTLVNIDSIGNYRLSKSVEIKNNHAYSLAVDADGLPSVYSKSVKVYDSCLTSWAAEYQSVSSKEGKLSVSFSCAPESDKELYLSVKAFGEGGIILPFRRYGPPSSDQECEFDSGLNLLSSNCYDMANGELEFPFEKKVFSYLHDGMYDVKKLQLEFVTYENTGEYYGGVSVGAIGFAEPNVTNSNIIGGYGYFGSKNVKVLVLEL